MAKPPATVLSSTHMDRHARGRSTPPVVTGSPDRGRGAVVESMGVPAGPDAESTDWSKAETLDRQG